MVPDQPGESDKKYLAGEYLRLLYAINPATRAEDIKAALEMMAPQSALKFAAYLKEQHILERQRAKSWQAIWTPQDVSIDRADPYSIRVIGKQEVTKLINNQVVQETKQLQLTLKLVADPAGRTDQNRRMGFLIAANAGASSAATTMLVQMTSGMVITLHVYPERDIDRVVHRCVIRYDRDSVVKARQIAGLAVNLNQREEAAPLKAVASIQMAPAVPIPEVAMQTEEDRINDLTEDSLAPAEAKAPCHGKKKLVMVGSLFALLLMVGMGSYLWLGAKEVRIKTAPRPADKVTSGSDLQKAAYDSFGRQNSAVIVATDPYGAYRQSGDPSQSQDNRSFAEVPAGADGFILVTALPEADLRVREVSALVIGLTLFAVNEGLARRPVDHIETLVDRFVARGLLPPDVERASASGALVSKRAKIIIRYRAEPLGLEVLSLGRERADGPAILGRILTGEDTPGPSLFIARQLGAVPIPASFLSKHHLTATNWSEEPFRELALTAQELEQIQSWLQQTPSEK